MSTLYLIRHGQASFGAPDYDVLSELGAEQSRRLGALWSERGHRLDACYTGPRTRQIDTARWFRERARAAGMDYPAPIQLPELDEYPAFRMLERWLPVVGTDDPEVGPIAGPGTDRDSRRRFERAFQRIVTLWATGELDAADIESFAAFHARVRRGLTHIMATQGRGKHVAVFTSGGAIGIAMQIALGLAADMTLRTAAAIVNASVTELRYRDPDSLSLVRFNAIPHLPDDALVTYR